MDEAAFAEALQGLVDNAVTGGAWSAPLGRVERALGARALMIHGYERFGRGGKHFFEASSGLPAESVVDYGHFEGRDTRIEQGLAAASGVLVCDHDVESLAALDREPIYADIFRRYDIGRFLGVRLGTTAGSGDRNIFLTLLKPNNAEAPTAQEAQRTLLLARILQSSMRASAALSVLRSENAAKTAALDHAPFGCILLQSGGRIREMNVAARRIVGRGDGLSAHNGVLTAQSAATQNEIVRLSDNRTATSRISITPVARPDGRPYVVMVIQLASDLSAWLDPGAATALAIFVDPESSVKQPEEIWRAAFDLTPAEAAVAALLLEGRSQREIAEARLVGFHTVHSQIKKIYEKLGARSQTQAAALLIRSASVSGS